MSNSTGNSTSESEIPFSVRVCINCFIMSFALMGNSLVIISILCVKRLRRVISNAFILNLAVCDVISVSINITWDLAEHMNEAFPFGPIGCKIVPPMGTFAINSSVLTLLAISLERYGLIVHPMRFTSTRQASNIAILCVHMVSVASVFPYAHSLTFRGNSNPSCEEAWSNTASRIYTVFLFLLQYAVPLPLIVFFYLISWIKIKQSNAKVIRSLGKTRCGKSYNGSRMSEGRLAAVRDRQTRRILLMFISVVLVFAVCMSPNQIIWFYRVFRESSLDGVTTAIFLWLTYSNSVLNPWIYGRFSPNFLSAYKVIVGKALGKIPEHYCKRKRPSFMDIKQRVNQHCRPGCDGLSLWPGTTAQSEPERACTQSSFEKKGAEESFLTSVGMELEIKLNECKERSDLSCMLMKGKDEGQHSNKGAYRRTLITSYLSAQTRSLSLLPSKVGYGGFAANLTQMPLQVDSVKKVLPESAKTVAMS